MEKGQFNTYKGYPLVRSGNEICYGAQTDEFFTRIIIQSAHKVKDLDVADKVTVMLMPTDTDKPIDVTLMKTAVRANLYEALELANTWLVNHNE